MKNFLFVLATPILAAVGSLAAQDKTPRLVEDPYYPLREQQRWVYQVIDKKAKGPAVKKQSVVTEVVKKVVVPLGAKNERGDDVTVPYIGYNLEVTGGGKVLEEQVVVKEDGVYRVNGAGKPIAPPLCFLRRNAEKKWSVDSRSENADLKGDFLADEETVQVPAGTFKTVVVRSSYLQVGGQKMQVAAWYAAGVGMVKQHVQTGNHEVILELEKMEAAK